MHALTHWVSKKKLSICLIATADPELVAATASSKMDRFLPCVEKDFENVEKFLSDCPINMKIPKVKDMSILVGYNFKESFGADLFDVNLKMGFDFDEDRLNEMEEIIRHFYIGDEEIVNTELAYYDSDFNFNYPAERSVTKFIENGAQKVFYYLFSYVGGINMMRGKTAEASHGGELGYLFGSDKTIDEIAPEDILMIQRMTTMWTNFVKYGDPTPETSEVLPVKWEPVTKGSPKYYMNIDSEMKLSKKPFYQRMSFWDLFYKLNEKYQKGYREN